MPTYLYGAAHRAGRTLAAIRRQRGYFKPQSSAEWNGPLPVAADTTALPVAPDAGPDAASASKGVLVLGATAGVDNYYVPVRAAAVVAVRRVARRVSARGGGRGPAGGHRRFCLLSIDTQTTIASRYMHDMTPRTIHWQF